MVGSFVRFAAVAVFSAFLAGCAGSPNSAYRGGNIAVPDAPLQCVPYARSHSKIALRGDAYTWWDQAAGRYTRAGTPSEGAVMVLNAYAGPKRAHLAVVREIVGSRDIRVDHANWLDDGAVYENDPVRDVSPDNDWTQVKVYNLRAAAWGSHIYPVQGFISPGSPGQQPMRLAQLPASKAELPDDEKTDDSDLLDDEN
jgi:hypothetical protein